MRNRLVKISLATVIFIFIFSYAVFGARIDGYTVVAGTFDNIDGGISISSVIQSLLIKDELLSEGEISAEFSSNVGEAQYPVGIVFAGRGIRDYKNVSGSNICYLRAYFSGNNIVIGKSEHGIASSIKSASIDDCVFDRDTVKLSVSFSLDGTVKVFVNDIEAINTSLNPKLFYGGELGICAGGDGNRFEITNIVVTSASHTEHIAGDIIPEIPATCIENGKKEHSVCTICEKLIYQKDGAWMVTTEEELTVLKDSNNHADSKESVQWTYDENEHKKLCRCGEVFISENHDIAASALEGKCTVCGYEKIHTCDDLTRIYATVGNCVTKGKREHYKCNGCSKLYIRSGNSYIEKKEAELESDIVPDNHIDSADALEWTYDNSGHYKICRCGEVLSSGKHDISASTPSVKCSVCAYERNHVCKYTKIPEILADCMKNGVKAHYKCDACKKLYIKNGDTYTEISASDLETPKSQSNHVDSPDNLEWSYDENTHNKTCRCGSVLVAGAHDISADSLSGACDICPYEKTHICEYVYTPAKSADCISDGMKEHYKCLVCGKLYLVCENKYFEIDIEDIKIKASHKPEKIASVLGSCITESCDEYYKCEICGKLFLDKNAENEIENPPKGEKDTRNHTDVNKDGICDLCLHGNKNKESKLIYYVLLIVVPIFLLLCAVFVIVNKKLFVK